MGKMGKLPDIVYGWVEIGACTGMALKGHLSSSLCPACICDVYSQDTMGR